MPLVLPRHPFVLFSDPFCFEAPGGRHKNPRWRARGKPGGGMEYNKNWKMCGKLEMEIKI